MFDGLKEKLGRFSDDVEEDVEDDAAEDVEGETVEGEPTTEDEPTAKGGPSEDADQPTASPDESRSEAAESESATQPATAAEPQTTAAADSPGQTASDDEGPSEETQPSASAEGAREATAERADETADVDSGGSAEATDDTNDRGLAEKAKLFATGKTVIDEDDLQDHLDDLEIALLQSDVEMDVAQEILDGVKANLTGETRRRLESTGNLVRDALREALYDVISVGQFDFEQRIAAAEKPIVIVFTGVNGVGKTTSIAKLSHYLEQQGHSSVLANGDTYRAGANEQLREHAENLDRTFISHEQGSDPTAVVYDAVEYAEANDVDVVLGDTAGRLHTSDDLMAQLEKIDRVIEPDMTLFVDEAVAGQDAVNRAREFDDAAAIDGTVLTKADADPQGGAAISIAHVTGKPILFLGTGQDYDDLERFEPETIVDRLLAE